MKTNENKKLPFYIKYINIICYGVCVIFSLFVLLMGLAVSIKDKEFNSKINAMLEYCDTVNSSISNNIVSGSNNTTNTIPTEQMFYDGKSALIYAYKNSIDEANSLSVEATGRISLSAPAGLYAKLQMDIYLERYSKTKVYEEVIAKVIDTNVPSSLINAVNSGCKRLKDGTNNAKVLVSQNVWYEGTKLKSDYKNAKINTDPEKKFFNDYFYIINEETIKEVTFFKTKKVNGVVQNYYVQVKLDAKSAVTKYKEVIAQQVNCDEPNFKSVLVTVIIDAFGNLVSFSSTDYFKLTLAGFNCEANSSITYSINGVNKENTFVYTDF